MTNERPTGPARVKRGLAEMLRGGVIMDVVTPEQARIAEDAGAVAVMALGPGRARIRRHRGQARESRPAVIEGMPPAVPLPRVAKGRRRDLRPAQRLAVPRGAECVVVGCGIVKSHDPAARAASIGAATTRSADADIVGKVSTGLGEAMRGEESGSVGTKRADRGW